MNNDQVAGKWEQLKGRAKLAWGELTDDDFLKAEGSTDKLYGVIQERVGDAREVIEATLRESADEQTEPPASGDGKWLKAKGLAKQALGEITADKALKASGVVDAARGDALQATSEANAGKKLPRPIAR